MGFPIQPNQEFTLTLTSYTGVISLDGLHFIVNSSIDDEQYPKTVAGSDLPTILQYQGTVESSIDVDLIADTPSSPLGTPSGWQPAPHKTFSSVSATHFVFTWWEGTARLDVVINS